MLKKIDKRIKKLAKAGGDKIYLAGHRTAFVQSREIITDHRAEVKALNVEMMTGFLDMAIDGMTNRERKIADYVLDAFKKEILAMIDGGE